MTEPHYRPPRAPRCRTCGGVDPDHWNGCPEMTPARARQERRELAALVLFVLALLASVLAASLLRAMGVF